MEDGIVENAEGKAGIIVQNLQNNIKNNINVELFFNHSMYSDIDIVIDYRVIKGHKLILSQNPSFCKMFDEAPDLKEIVLSDHISNLVESDIKFLFCSELDNQEKKDEFLKFSSEACETFLRYVYATEIEKEKVNLDLILAAHKFTDDKLQEFCENHLIKNVNMQNATRTLLVSLKTNCEKLKKQTCLLMARNFCEMKFNKDFSLVLENDEAMSAILDVFDECHTIVLTDRLDKLCNLKIKIDFLGTANLLMTVGNYHFLTHKNILSERNAVFKVIIDTASTDGFPTSVRIPDVDQNTFKIFLQYIYTRIVDEWNISKELLGLAHKYTHTELKEKCEFEFIKKLNNENLIDSLMIATEFKCKTLEMITSNSIVIKYDEMKKHRDYPMLIKNYDAATVIVNTFHKQLMIGKWCGHFSNVFVFYVVYSKDNYSEVFQVKDIYFRTCIRCLDSVTIYLTRVLNDGMGLRACCSFELINANTQHNISRFLYHEFNVSSNHIAWHDCIRWSNLIDPKNGYIQNGAIRLRLQLDVM